MPIFYKRNVHSQKYRVLFLYFPFFHEKTTSLMPIFCWKNIHLQKTSCSYALFFPNFTKKLLLSCPYSVKKRSFSKKHTALMPIFCQKNVHSLKKRYSHLIFFFQSFSWKTPAFMHIFDQNNRQFCQHYTISWAKKVNTMLFLSNFSQEITALMPIFCQKNLHSPKNTMFSYPYLIKKSSILWKTQCSHVYFFKKTNCCYAHIW